MKYLKLSSVLVALFFVFGCGSKSVERDGNTTQTTTASDNQEMQADNQTPSETTVSRGGKDLPEGGFMPDGSSSGADDEMNNGATNSTDEDSQYVGNNNNDDVAYGEDSTDEGSENGAVVLNSLSPIYFDFDRYDIRSDMKEYVRANADYIKKQNMKSIVLEGNTDEFGGDEYNTALGLKRALSVRDALVLQGLPKNMFSTISYGMHKPACKEKTAECYAKNRRTEIVEKQ